MQTMSSAIAILMLSIFAYEEETTHTPVYVPEPPSTEAALPGSDSASDEPQTEPVKPRLIERPNQETMETAAPADTVYTVQLGAFKSRERAFALYWELSRKIMPLQISAPSEKDKLYRVRYGSFPNYDEAKVAVEKLRKLGIQCFVTTIEASRETVKPPKPPVQPDTLPANSSAESTTESSH